YPSPQRIVTFVKIPQFPGTSTKPPNFTRLEDRVFTLFKKVIYFNEDQWRYWDTGELVEEAQFQKDHLENEPPPSAVEYEGVFYYREHPLVYIPTAKVFVYKDLNSLVPDDVWDETPAPTELEKSFHLPEDLQIKRLPPRREGEGSKTASTSRKTSTSQSSPSSKRRTETPEPSKTPKPPQSKCYNHSDTMLLVTYGLSH